MLIVKVEKNNIERALKKYKSKVIKTRQMREINKRKEYTKDSEVEREKRKKAVYVQKKKREEED